MTAPFRLSHLARFGAPPLFTEQLHVAQLNLPQWERVQATFEDILHRRYYANHGPLVRHFEEKLAEALGVAHVVCVTNGTVALMVLARALEISGEVIVPAFTFPATVQALAWAGLTPVFADVSPQTHMMTAEHVAQRLSARTAGVLGVHLWGQTCTPHALEELAAAHDLALFFDACHAFGCTSGGRDIATFGQGAAFSFHATKIVNALEGGAIATNDRALADRLRSIRSFHAEENLAPVAVRMNAKMSEAQAAMGLLSLEDYSSNLETNRRCHLDYRAALDGIEGIRMVAGDNAERGDRERNNYQYVVLEIDADRYGLDRDALVELLQAENVICRRHFCPPAHRLSACRQYLTGAKSLPVTERLSRSLMQLPTGNSLPPNAVERICERLRWIGSNAALIRKNLRDGS